ncbi:GntR family transcriptional regulator [Isoptericola aurantiacus]|uniref:GntR family transcriptional regulator n=1 Tax=Isoptericola aurantiacus TaxID=3377839 RepID=UPI00383B1E74
MTDITVDLHAAVPAYEQIRRQVAGLVAVGTLVPGDRLPASRDLARDLGIAVGTVQRAYRELESTGVVTSRRRTGTVVAEGTGPGAGSRDPRPALVEELRTVVARARAAGLTDETILDIAHGVLRGPDAAAGASADR